MGKRNGRYVFCCTLEIQWDTLPNQVPPKLLPYLPSKSADVEDLGSNYDVCVCWLYRVRIQHAGLIKLFDLYFIETFAHY